jgi:hypothetical protein
MVARGSWRRAIYRKGRETGGTIAALAVECLGGSFLIREYAVDYLGERREPTVIFIGCRLFRRPTAICQLDCKKLAERFGSPHG